jgi:ArsR family transcriptional regulator
VDACVCVLVLHHLDKPGAALAEMARVLRADRGGGMALIVDMVEHTREEFRTAMGHRHLGFSAEQMNRMMKGAGFADVRFQTLPADPDARGPGLFVATGRIR